MKQVTVIALCDLQSLGKASENSILPTCMYQYLENYFISSRSSILTKNQEY